MFTSELAVSLPPLYGLVYMVPGTVIPEVDIWGRDEAQDFGPGGCHNLISLSRYKSARFLRGGMNRQVVKGR